MRDYILYSDEELMREIKADNMFAFDTLYNKYCKRVYKFSFSILKSHEESENLMQDVFLNLWENRYRVEKDSSVRSYLFSITYNSAISVIRKKVRETDFIDQLKYVGKISEDTVNMEIEYLELTSRLGEIIKTLPPRQKEVYLLQKVEGLKYNEIADRLNISVNTIENHMSRALKTIREKLGNYSLLSVLFWFLFV